MDSKKWQVHYKLDGIKTWFRQSTDTADVKAAAAIAERMWMKATFDHEAGRPVISKKFKPVAEMVLHRLDAEIKAGTARPSTKDYVSAIRLYLIPFYGAYNIDGIKPAVISEFHTWRSVKVGRELSGSAQNNHNAALNVIFDEARAGSDDGLCAYFYQPCPHKPHQNDPRTAGYLCAVHGCHGHARWH